MRFPILVFTEGFIQGGIKDVRYLTRWPGVALTRRPLHGGTVIDADGNRFAIVRVTPKGRIWSLESLLWKRGLVKIDVELGPPMLITLHAAKKELIDLFERTKWYRKSYPQWRSYAQDIESAASFEQLINVVDYFPSPSC